MKVLRVIANFFPQYSGPAFQVATISRELTAHGIKSVILTATAADACPAVPGTTDGLTIVRGGAELLPATLASERPDAVHVHGLRSGLVAAAVRAARRRGVPVVATPHGSLGGYRRIIGSAWRQLPFRLHDRLLLPRVLRGLDLLIVNSLVEAEEATAYGLGARTEVIPIGVAAACSAQRGAGNTDSTLRLLTAGRFTENRDLNRLCALLGEPEGWQLRAVGGQVKNSRFGRAAATLPDGALTCAGEKFGSDLDAEYAAADVFIYHARYESFGQTILQAAAAGLPLLVSAVGVARELVIPGETGYFLTDDAAENRRHLMQLRDPERRAAMGQRLQELVRTRYVWEKIIPAYAACYRRLRRDTSRC